MIIGNGGPAVVISAETALLLERFCKVTELRVRLRGRNPRVAQELLDLRHVAMQYEEPALPEAEVGFAEVAAELDQRLMSVAEVADLLGLTDRAVRLACSQERLEAQQVGGRWRITREAYEEYRAARAA